MPAVAAVLDRHSVTAGDLDAVACGAGPGSFTSLRIAASIAKGIAVARTIPLLVTPSPLLVVAGARPTLAEGRYLVALDAMRGDCFAQEVRVDRQGGLHPGRAWRASRSAVESAAASTGAVIVGPAEAEPREPLARGFGDLIRQQLAGHADVASWEPEYGRKAEAQVKWEAAHGRALPEAR